MWTNGPEFNIYTVPLCHMEIYTVSQVRITSFPWTHLSVRPFFGSKVRFMSHLLLSRIFQGISRLNSKSWGFVAVLPISISFHTTTPNSCLINVRCGSPCNRFKWNNWVKKWKWSISNCNSAWHIERVLERQVQLQLANWKLNKSQRKLNKPELQLRFSMCSLAYGLHSEAMEIRISLCLNREILPGGREIGRKGQIRPKIGRSPAKTGVLAGL